MRDSFILKTCLQIVVVVILILFGCGYLIYLNRAVIADKLLDYTIQGMTGVISSKNQKSSNWLDALLNSGTDGVKNTMLDAVAKRGLSGNNTSGQRVQGLATMADMLANGAGNGEMDINQMAQALVDSLGINNNNKQQNRQYAPHDVNALDSKGRTLLMNVCRVDVTPKVIKMLLQYGADINAKDNNGRTALMYAAAFNENPEVIKLLLERGAEVGIRDKKGKTAADYATSKQIIELLK
ncbi:MAG: ankyrin repeat domain-containing protein [Alphaproteobacteria bacterium]|nr:ankyrin repeat domain-containing protein [Alphaproteobacteria bacterium]